MIVEVYEKKEIDVSLLIEEIHRSLKASEKEDCIRLEKEIAYDIASVLNVVDANRLCPNQFFNTQIVHPLNNFGYGNHF